MLGKAKRLSFSLRDHVMGSSPILATKIFAAMVKGLRRLPFTEESRVRISLVVRLNTDASIKIRSGGV